MQFTECLEYILDLRKFTLFGNHTQSFSKTRSKREFSHGPLCRCHAILTSFCFVRTNRTLPPSICLSFQIKYIGKFQKNPWQAHGNMGHQEELPAFICRCCRLRCSTSDLQNILILFKIIEENGY